MSETKVLWIERVKGLVGNKIGLLTLFWVVRVYPRLYVAFFTIWIWFFVISGFRNNFFNVC